MESTAWPGFDVLGQRLRHPGREFAQRLARRVREPREQQRFVAPDHFDERGAGPIRARGDVPHERRRLERHAGGERPEDDQPLAGLQIERHLDGELAVGLELLLVNRSPARTLTIAVEGRRIAPAGHAFVCDKFRRAPQHCVAGTWLIQSVTSSKLRMTGCASILAAGHHDHAHTATCAETAALAASSSPTTSETNSIADGEV